MAGILSGQNGSPSSMRFTFVLTTIGVFIILVAVAFYILACAFMEGLGEPSWESIGIFCVGIATVVTGTGWNKVQQKKIENANQVPK